MSIGHGSGSFLRAGTAALILVGSLAMPAAAAPPANDDRGEATVIGALPYQDSVDTSEATPQGNDPQCSTGPGNPTVWYSFTPEESGTYGVTTSGSGYDTTLVVAARDNGDVTVIECNDDAGALTSAILWLAEAGQEYLIMAGACCGSPGGQLQLALLRDPPTPSVQITLQKSGKINKFGSAVVRGRLQCTGATGATAFVEANAKQTAGRFFIRGYGGVEQSCNRPVRIRVQGNIGKFRPGKAAVRLNAFVCAFSCGGDSAKATVRLTRAR